MTTGLWRALCADLTVPRYGTGTRRVMPASATLQRIRPLLPRAGITRIADLTGLDWIGLPVYQAVRPTSRVLVVAMGKGLTRPEAQVSAAMESIEGFHAEEITGPVVTETVGVMRRELAYDPYALPLSTPTFLDDDLPVEWLPATDLDRGTPTWAPKQLCQLDFRVEARVHLPLFRRSSNGLASGNTIAEAVIHGLCELIERDACAWNDAARFDPEHVVDPDSVTAQPIRRVLDRLAAAGIRTSIVDMTGPTGLPCFEVWLDDEDGPGLMRGAGCHPSRMIALVRALTEAAQSRLTYISGSRDDIHRTTYRPASSRMDLDEFLPSTRQARRAYGSVPALPLRSSQAQVGELVRRIRLATGMAPLAVDLSRPEMGVPVVFVIAPGLGGRRHL